jgi:phosphatidylserine/phosphatidylglycerophosphate/cardiolipin synthase-like enzyme
VTPTLPYVVRRSLVVALVAGLALALLVVTGPRRSPDGAGAAAPRPAAAKVLNYTPVTGAIFNRPIGTVADQRRIFTHVNNTIAAAPSGSTIRIAVFSFSEKATADRLVAAKARGVHVQLIFDDHTKYAQELRLQKALGRNANAASFARFCHQSCRGTSGGNMHDKVFLFSKAGHASNVLMVGSDNLTGYNATRQWSDVYTIANDPAMYYTYAGFFDQMKYDRPSGGFYEPEINGYQTQFYPDAGTTEATDPLTLMLNGVTCAGASPGTGVGGETLVRLSQHAWNGTRGIYLAKHVAALRAQGCVVQVIYGVGTGSTVKSILTKAGVQLSTIRHPKARTHQKTFMVSGNYEGNPAAQVVFTGSHNWSNGALKRDDVMLRIEDPAAYAQYAANFDDIWNHG